MSFRYQSVWSAAIAVALVHSAVLGWMVWDRLSLLRNGREIVLDVTPVDPRSLFRGDYVILNYEITQLDGSLFDTPVSTNNQIYVTAQDSAGKWKAVKASLKKPNQLGPGELLLRGRVTNAFGAADGKFASARVAYGIESYFVPEGTGLELEQKVREQKMAAILAVDTSGTAAIKGLVVDGERLLDPPLF